jgi:hypothetical protein
MILSHVSSINDNWNVLDTLIVAGDSPITMYDCLKDYLVPGGTYYTNDSYNSFPPVNTWNYCNVAIGLLGYLVEAITDTAFEDYCQQYIFAPLQMNETSWFLANLDTSHIARPYMWTSSGYEPYPHQGIPLYPTGWLRTSSLQLASFLNAFMQKGKLENFRILDSTTVKLITTIHYPEIPIGGGYPDSSQGLIWYWENFGDRVVWGHSGGTFGAVTTMFYSEHEKTGVIVLANGNSFQTPYPWRGVSNITVALFDYATNIVTGNAKYIENELNLYALTQNYPNPFNSLTTIKFDLPKTSEVTLKIFNILGEEVATIVSENLSVGSYSYEWDASNLPSGVYLYRLEAEEFVEIKKMVLLR